MIKIRWYVFLTFLFMAWFAGAVYGEELHEIIVTNSPRLELKVKPELDLTIAEMLDPSQSFTQGGYGGFAGYRERGQQTIHSQIYRNGIPVNDSGTGWYDFAHDIPTGGERITLVQGSNSTIYGSGSLAGTVFINDTFDNRFMIRAGSKSAMTHISSELGFSFTAFGANNDSVRSDNDEDDMYKNYTVRGEYGNFNLVYTDYSYDYDKCYQPTFMQESELVFSMSLFSDDCKQEGNRGTVSYNDDNLTVGYSWNQADFPNEGNGYESKSQRFYTDARTELYGALIGATINAERFAGQTRERVEVYGEYSGFSVRTDGNNVVARVGFYVPIHKTVINVAMGTSFREPTLYEQYGDAYVMSNSNLNPEDSAGIDVSWGPVTAFAYNFKEGITYSFADNQFQNTGEYSTSGVRYQDNITMNGVDYSVFAGYTDSDQPFVSEWKGSVTANWNGLFTQINSNQWATTFDIGYERDGLFATVTNLTDETYEIQYGYPMGGVEFHVGYKYGY